MLEGKAIIKGTDMPVKLQTRAVSSASEALDLFDVADCRSIAAYVKKELDRESGVAWQCVVGYNFGCYFTHAQGTYIYFCLERLHFLVFRGSSSLLPSSRNV